MYISKHYCERIYIILGNSGHNKDVSLTLTGLAQQRKLDTWPLCTFFCIKAHSFEILNIGNKNRFQHPEAYSELCKTLKMEHFAKIYNSFLALTIFAKHSIFDLGQSSEYASGIII